MKRRFARANSIEPDIADLDVVRRQMRDNRRALDDLSMEEHSSRNTISDAANEETQRLIREYRSQQKYAQLRSRTAETTLPQNLVARLTELIKVSRAAEEDERQRKRDEHMANVKKTADETRTWIGEFKAQSAVRQTEQHAQQHQLVHDRRADDAKKQAVARAEIIARNAAAADALRLTLESKRHEAQMQDDAVREQQRRHVHEERDQSHSPLLFLQLPHLRATLSVTPEVAKRSTKSAVSAATHDKSVGPFVADQHSASRADTHSRHEVSLVDKVRKTVAARPRPLDVEALRVKAGR